jgi:hypothetical protein
MDAMVIRKRQNFLASADVSSHSEKSPVHRKDLICTVCGAPATGFNFSVITCMCCKAFFRRNALFGLPSLQCRYSTETCEIDMKTRRDCSYCRLKKCFAVGMKKELILTDELKRMKREKILANRQLTVNLARPIATFNGRQGVHWNDVHSSHISNISNTFEVYCHAPLALFEKTEYELLGQQPIKSRIKIQNYYEYYGKHEASLTQFFKRIPELQQFSDDQQLALCKHNMRFLIRVGIIETRRDDLPLWPAVNLLLESIFGKALVDETDQLLQHFKEQTSNSICIRLLLVILLFSTYSSYTGYLDTLDLYKIQVKYTELLWSYLIKCYDQCTACSKFATMIRYCLYLQTIGHSAELKREEIERLRLSLECI